MSEPRKRTAAPLRARNVTVTRGDRIVLDAVDVTVAVGHRIGLVGPNGVGKSTLLRTLAGEIRPTSGRVERTPPTATVGHLTQEPSTRDELTRELLARRTGVAQATTDLDTATTAIAAGDTGADDRYSLALERWLSLGGADLDSRIGEVWHDIGLAPGLLDQSTRHLSGGEAARAGLAALLLARFDVYLLDEPTNDLDLDGLERLERWITSLQDAVMLVSHDRTFLERTITDVVEIDEFSHRTTRFAGGWHAYVEERATADRHAWERFEQYDTQRTTLAARSQREREWATQGVAKVRRSDERDKHIRRFKVNQTEQLAGRAARTDRAIERLEQVDKPRQPWQLQLRIAAAGRPGDVVARLDGAVVEAGTFTLGPIDLQIDAGDRIGLIGANGAGKTTMLAALFGDVELAAGSRYVGPSVVVGEIDQVRGGLAGDRTLLRAFQDETRADLEEGDVRTLLAKFGLVADHVVRRATTLSPGERTRASLALVMANGANVLVLDEPTNHLDLPAIEQLEAALDSFDGTIVLVSHDRTLLDHVSLDRWLRLAGGRLVD